MKRTTVLAIMASALLFTDCNRVPLTGRRQFNLIGDSEMHAMSFSQYQEVISSSNLARNQQQTALVKRVGQKISQAVEAYLIAEGMGDRVEGFEWEFNLLESNEVNAWCMPGGKVAFYTGIMGICQDETGVAVVMGHEIAHAIARHGSERMSQAMTTQLGGMALSSALQTQPEQTQELAMLAYGVGTQVGATLPFSRLHESESDKMGLFFMAMAGYNPQQAPAFWQRMAANGGGGVPEFLSTHPSHETRINDLNEWMPEAMTYYNAAQ